METAEAAPLAPGPHVSLPEAVCFTREPFRILLAHSCPAGESAAGQQAVEGWGAEAPQLGLAACPGT